MLAIEGWSVPEVEAKKRMKLVCTIAIVPVLVLLLILSQQRRDAEPTLSP